MPVYDLTVIVQCPEFFCMVKEKGKSLIGSFGVVFE